MTTFTGNVLSVYGLLSIIGFIYMCFSIPRNAHYNTSGKAIWFVGTFASPFVAAIAWFFWGRKQGFERLFGGVDNAIASAEQSPQFQQYLKEQQGVDPLIFPDDKRF